MDLEKAIKEFISNMRRRGYSARTVDAYIFDLFHFQKFLEKFGSESSKSFAQLAEIDKAAILSWIDDQLNNNNSPRTISRKLSSLRSFFKFCLSESFVEKSPVENITPPKFRRQPPEALSQDEVRQLLSGIPPDSIHYLRDRAIVHLMYSTGLRVSELVSLTVESVDFDQDIIRVLGKGSKERLLPISGTTKTTLLDYALTREKAFSRSNTPKSPFFLRVDGIPLTPRMIQYMLQRLGVRSMVRHHVHPHLLRHSIATHLVEEGASLEAVRQTLGHENLSTTSVYLKTSKKFLMDEHKKFNPTDKISK